MGKVCSLCNKSKTRKLEPLLNDQDLREVREEKEKKFPSYTSSLDNYFKPVEDSYNFLKFLQMYEFLLLFSHTKPHDQHEIEIATRNVDRPNYYQEITKEEFLIFIENKILRNYLLIPIVNDDHDNSAIFKDLMAELFDALIFATIDHFKKKNPGVKVKKGSIRTVKKIFLFVLPLLYSQSSDTAKMDFFFKLFSANDRFVNSEELRDFLYYLFIIPSTCVFRAIKQLGEKYPNKFKKLSNEEYLNKLDAFEIDDIVRLINIFTDAFFKSGEVVQKFEYEQKFFPGDFGWIFNPKGIRSMLERHNDVKVPIHE